MMLVFCRLFYLKKKYIKQTLSFHLLYDVRERYSGLFAENNEWENRTRTQTNVQWNSDKRIP